ncbi:conserved domain protein [Ruminococcus albus 8]|uniref:Conserved domain protein n=1 Tax=Ruminococcus albus 8 TaxID=246199 RepID=E9SET2_RUMAL|nr:conserved domain protein [Ruminococcus albus 8]
MEKTEDDWFDDYVFTVTAIVHHDTMTKEEIKEKLNEQNILECCEILE